MAGRLSARETGGASGATDPLYDAKGDVIVGTGDNAAARLAVGTNGKVLAAASGETTGVKWDWPGARVVDEVHATTTVVNTAAETQLMSLTLPANLVAAGDVLRVVTIGDILNNSGSTVTTSFLFKLGATTALQSNGFGVASNANRRKWYFVYDVFCESTSAQRVGVFSVLTNAVSSNWVWATTNTTTGAGYGTAAESTASALSVVMTTALGGADANLDCRLHAATMMHARKI